LPGGGGAVLAWAGPWPHDLRWWDRRLRTATAGQGRRRRALWQVIVGDGDSGVGVACLVAVRRGCAGVEALYD
jgi:hypothetical protein